jgi:hypothetical protein
MNVDLPGVFGPQACWTVLVGGAVFLAGGALFGLLAVALREMPLAVGAIAPAGCGIVLHQRSAIAPPAAEPRAAVRMFDGLAAPVPSRAPPTFRARRSRLVLCRSGASALE